MKFTEALTLSPKEMPAVLTFKMIPLTPVVIDTPETLRELPAVRAFQIPGNVTNSDPDAMVVLCGMLAKVRVKLIMPPPIGACPVSPTK